MEQDVALGDVGVAVGDQRLDQRLHFLDMLRGARLDRRRQHAQRLDIVVELLGGALGKVADRHAFFRRAGVDLVVDVGDVAHVGDVLCAVHVAQEAEQHVEDHDGTRVADVRVVVDGGPAHVHAHVLRIERHEPLLAPRQRVVEHQWMHFGHDGP